jgi:hypothetical protein
MNAEKFENILACVKDMDDAQTSRLLNAVMKKQQIIPIMSFAKSDYDTVEQPLTNDEWEELDNNIVCKSHPDISASMIEPFRKWITKKVREVKEKSNMDNIPLSHTTDEETFVDPV